MKAPSGVVKSGNQKCIEDGLFPAHTGLHQRREGDRPFRKLVHNQTDPRHHARSRTDAESNGIDDAIHKGMDSNAFQGDNTESKLRLLRPVFDEFVAGRT